MKFQLVIEQDNKRLILLPENPGESQILASLLPLTPNEVSVDNRVRPAIAEVEAEWSSDRTPYKKLLKMKVKFGDGEAADVG